MESLVGSLLQHTQTSAAGAATRLGVSPSTMSRAARGQTGLSLTTAQQLGELVGYQLAFTPIASDDAVAMFDRLFTVGSITDPKLKHWEDVLKMSKQFDTLAGTLNRLAKHCSIAGRDGRETLAPRNYWDAAEVINGASGQWLVSGYYPLTQAGIDVDDEAAPFVFYSDEPQQCLTAMSDIRHGAARQCWVLPMSEDAWMHRHLVGVAGRYVSIGRAVMDAWLTTDQTALIEELSK